MAQAQASYSRFRRGYREGKFLVLHLSACGSFNVIASHSRGTYVAGEAAAFRAAREDFFAQVCSDSLFLQLYSQS